MAAALVDRGKLTLEFQKNTDNADGHHVHAEGGWRVARVSQALTRFVAALRNALVATLSVAFGLAACEASLRLFHPRYAVPAEALREATPAAGKTSFHPDTRVEHRWIDNNLGGRQSRDFPPPVLDRTVNIAFFGDSQTENVRMPAQYSYTEPLDFLLNVAAGVSDGSTGSVAIPQPRFSVLNFGRRGYGPARSYLRWLQAPARDKMAHVFYMVCKNDLADLRKAFRSKHVRLSASGEILAGDALHTPAWKRTLAHLHLTYLAIDAWQRAVSAWPANRSRDELVDSPDEGQPSSQDDLTMFRDLVGRWKREVEAHGAAFHVVLLPNPVVGFGGRQRNEWLRSLRADSAFATEIGYLDLAKCFEIEIPGFDYRDWSFDNDPHWNPAANMVAATCLYRYLEDALGLPERTDEDLAHARHAYYNAFLNSRAWEGQRYMPDAAWVRPSGAGRTHGLGETIVAKYLALEFVPQGEDRWLGAVRTAREAGASATSVWDVYANAQERLLVYVKSPCTADWRARDLAARFFLHGVPFTFEKLTTHDARSGYANLDRASLTYVRRGKD